MTRTRTRGYVAFLCAFFVLLGALCAPTAAAMTLEETQSPAPAAPVYHVKLDARTIADGEELSFETVAPELAGNPFAAEYYPGALTVEVTGQIVIENGGCLTIGTLSAGNEKEQGPAIRGELAPDGLIVVKAGGRLILKTARLELSGEGLFLVQEPGGSVELTDTALDDALIQWAPPTVDNTYQRPLELWLEEGTALTEALLPQTAQGNLQAHGVTEFASFPLRWALESYDGQDSGQRTLTGNFLDENGVVLPSVRPLELTVHWVKPDELAVTGTAWLGQSAASAKLYLKELPDDAEEVWGEVSTDGGKSWQRWEGFSLQSDGDTPAGVFSLPDATPRHLRIRATGEKGRRYWTSGSVLLPKEETKPSDQGGNRGGSTTVVKPERTPAPEPSPSPASTPTPVPVPTPTLAPSAEPTPVPTPSQVPVLATVEPSPSAEPTPTPMTELTPTPSAGHVLDAPPTVKPTPVPPATPIPALTPTAEATAAPTPAPTSPADTQPAATPTPTPEPLPAPEKEPLPAAVQGLLAVAGLAVCVAFGVLVTRKRK